MTKRMVVIAKYGKLEYKGTAYPYNENAFDEQRKSCIEDIKR